MAQLQQAAADPLIECQGVTKQFGGVTALRDVSLSVRRGEVHALVGENGAGKSTLGKLLAGIHRPDAGRLLLDGRARHFHAPRDALLAGVGMVHQELAFCPDLSVAENLALGRYPRRYGWFVDRRAMHAAARRQLERIGASLDVTQPMRRLSTAQEQLVQIACAVSAGARIVIFDEPTSSLSEAESRRLFDLIRELKAHGVTLLYISHRLPEIFALADRISVLRDGRHVDTLARADVTEDALIRLMIGRPLEAFFPARRDRPAGPVRLRVRNLSLPGAFASVAFDLHAGEILGLAGLVGAGRSAVAQALFGLEPRVTGTVTIEGHSWRRGAIRDALRSGLGFVPEDRKRQGLVLALSGRENVALPNLDRFSRFGFMRRRLERRETQALFAALDVRAPSLDTPVEALSGGNQQKVVLAKWLARRPGILIVDEPTRGVDVGAKAAIHQWLDDLAAQGVAILLISSELPELLNLAGRILVMRAGRLVGELRHTEADQEKLLRWMAGMETPNNEPAAK